LTLIVALRTPKENASDEELQAIDQAALFALAELRKLADCAPLRLDSGNGRAIVFPITSQANTIESARLLKTAIEGACDWFKRRV